MAGLRWLHVVGRDHAAALTAIVWSAFDGCTPVAEITLPPALTEIGVRAFEGCAPLAEIMLPPTLIVIGEGALEQCTSLSEITLPPGPVTIAGAVFGYPGTPRRSSDGFCTQNGSAARRTRPYWRFASDSNRLPQPV